MQYKVMPAAQAVEQMQETVSCLSHILLDPETARHWADLLQTKGNIFFRIEDFRSSEALHSAPDGVQNRCSLQGVGELQSIIFRLC